MAIISKANKSSSQAKNGGGGGCSSTVPSTTRNGGGDSNTNNNNKRLDLQEKVQEIEHVLSSETVDLWKLRELALTQGGLVNDDIRKRAWPKLVGIHDVFFRNDEDDDDDNEKEKEEDRQRITNAAFGARRRRDFANELLFQGPKEKELRSKTIDEYLQLRPSSAMDDLDSMTIMTAGSAGRAASMRQLKAGRPPRFPSPSSNKERPQDASNDNDINDGVAEEENDNEDEYDDDDDDDHSVASAASLNSPLKSTKTSSRNERSLSRSRNGRKGNVNSDLRPGSSRESKSRQQSKGGGGSSDGTSSTKTRNTKSAVVPIVAVCLDFEQIERDVTRCTWHLLTGSQRAQRLQMEHLAKSRRNRVSKLIKRKQRRLANLINYTLVQSYSNAKTKKNDINNNSNRLNGGYRDSDRLRYYQGYHDVACIFLSSLGGKTFPYSSSFKSSLQQSLGGGGPSSAAAAANTASLEVASAVLLRVSESHLRDCLRSNFLQLQTALRLSLFPLLAKLDPTLHKHLQFADMEPYFCLSWIITWFAHEVRDTELVKRLFDAFLVSHPLLPLYLSAAMIVHPTNRQEVLECECDFSLLHQTLAGLPKNSSMTGWKYQPGSGYVTDDDEADGTVSTGTGASIDESTEFLLVERLDHSTNTNSTPNKNNNFTQQETGSLVSSTLSLSLEPPAPVPFQVLIDNALEIMRKIPPHRLLHLSRWYYGCEQVDEWLEMAPDIEWFRETPPTWAVAKTAKADWVLKNRHRIMRHKQATSLRRRRTTQLQSTGTSNKRSRRVHSQETAFDETVPLLQDPSFTDDLDDNNTESIFSYLDEHKDTLAVIGAGFGPGDDDEARRKARKRRKTTMVAGAVVIAIVAVAVGIAAVQYNNSTEDQNSSSLVTSTGNVPASTGNTGTMAPADGMDHPLSVDEPRVNSQSNSKIISAKSGRQRPVLASPIEKFSGNDSPSRPPVSGKRLDASPQPKVRPSAIPFEPVDIAPSTSGNVPQSDVAKTFEPASPHSASTESLPKTDEHLPRTRRPSFRLFDLTHCSEVLTALQRVSVRMAKKITSVVAIYAVRIEPQIRLTLQKMNTFLILAKDSEIATYTMSMSQLTTKAFSQLGLKMKDSIVIKQVLLFSASTLKATKLKLDKLGGKKEKNAGGETTEACTRKMKVPRNLGSVIRGTSTSPIGQHVHRALQQVASNPVWNKVVETTIGALMGASFSSLYGRQICH